MTTLRRIAAAAALTLVVAAVTACGGGSGGDKTATPAGSPTTARTQTATGTATSGTPATVDIRSLDLANVPDVAALVADSGGAFRQNEVQYADVTGDGVAEAIVPISSGGTMGDIAFIVLMAKGDATETLLKEYPQADQGLSVSVEDGKLVMTQPVPGPDDPLCCPSFLKHTTYAWNGLAMALESATTVPNPNGGAKGTPSGELPGAESTPAPPPTQAPGLAPEGTAASGNRNKPPEPGASQ